MTYQFSHTRKKQTTQIVAIYALFGIIWIYGSDSVLNWLVHDPATMTRIAVMKGVLFILCTATLLFTLVNRFAKQIIAAEKSQMDRLRLTQLTMDVSSDEIIWTDSSANIIMQIIQQVSFWDTHPKNF
jgi:hypothetical protein